MENVKASKITVVLLFLFFLLVFGLVMAFFTFLYDDDRDLVMLVLVAGVMGSFVHASRSFAFYVGNRDLKSSWIIWYFLLIPVGVSLAMLTYLVILGGILGSSDTSSSNRYGIAAICGLSSMFSEVTVAKLKEIFEQVFASAEKSRMKDPASQNEGPADHV